MRGGMVSDPDAINEQKVIESYDGNLRVTFINSDGYAVVDNLVEVTDMENHNERPEVVEARRNGYGSDIRKSETLQKNSFYYAVELDNGYVKSFKRSKQYDKYYDKCITCRCVVVCYAICDKLYKLTSAYKEYRRANRISSRQYGCIRFHKGV